MKRVLKLLLFVFAIGMVAGIAVAFKQRERILAMSDDELRAFLADKIGDKVPPEQLLAIQDAVVARVSEMRPLAEVTGTVAYRERIAMPPDAVVIVTLSDTSLMDAPAIEIGAHVIDNPGQVPVPYAIGYDPGEIIENHTYTVRATITAGDDLLWTTDTAYQVITRGNPTTADLMLVRVPERVPE
jgi:putative lipoprotein